MPWYEYSALPGARPQPLVQVHFWHGTRRVLLVALVDSGADSSLVAASYAELLGLDRTAAQVESSTGADGEDFSTLFWPGAPLELQFGPRRFPFRGRFIDFPPNRDGMNLLGREDFFRQFVVQFWDAAELMNIDLSPDFPTPPLS